MKQASIVGLNMVFSRKNKKVDGNGFVGLLNNNEDLYAYVDTCISSIGIYYPTTRRLLQGIGLSIPIMVGP